MTVEELLSELKLYLRIDELDTTDDEYLKQFCIAADGFISSLYRFNIITKPVETVQLLSTTRGAKIYLPQVPVVDGTITITRPDDATEDTPFTLINGVIMFDKPVDYTLGAFKVTYESGVDNSVIYGADIQHCVQLAAWLFRTADKGLEGIDQISTGVKESAKMFAGVPQNIALHFEGRQPIRL
jgi:hypothetical protein